MKVYTDSIDFAERLLGKDRDWKTERQTVEDEHSDIRTLLRALFPVSNSIP